MIVVIGITSNFVQMIVTTGVEPPKEFVGTLSVVSPSTKIVICISNNTQTCIATLYIMVSVGYYWSYANLGLLVMTGVDSMLLIAFIVCAVTLGKPMSFLNCYVIGKSSKEVDAQYAYAFVTAAAQNLNTSGSGLDLRHWAGVTQTNCFQAKTVWGMAIALWYVRICQTSKIKSLIVSSILFTVSCALLPTLWFKNKKATPKVISEA
jgi:hypothetical protein